MRRILAQRRWTPLGKKWLENCRAYSVPASSKVVRDERFATLDDQDIKHFSGIVGSKGLVVDKDELEVANTDWMRKFKGSAQLLLRPQSSNQVAEILKYSSSRRIAVVPQGGNTGLVGGSVPVFDEVIVNLGAMNSIISFDEVSGILICEAGCILETLDKFLADKGFMFPLDLGAKGSCQIGGNVSTNAGGLRLIRYGSLHGNILGLEVVLSDGTILDMLSSLRKDNTGYDLKQLFIGAEGTLGVVTKVAVLTPQKLPSVNVGFLACTDYTSCQKMLLEARKHLGEVLSAFEFIDSFALDMVLKHSGHRHPLPDAKEKFYLLIETTGSNQSHDKEKLDNFVETVLTQGLVVDGTIAQDNTQISNFWHIREGIAEALGKAGAVYKYDLSIPIKDLYNLVEILRERLGGLATVVAYGHLGDGNLHLNISAPDYDEKLIAKIEPFVYEWTAAHKGSVSAEHGLGFMKAHAIHYSRSPETVELMRKMKAMLDPNGILNPYKVIA
ncbi:D-2-hydroxyglutarate dehydrogenase, mitochondrial [Selaginella moellendorffii]|uniref:D-2-hydroxyglutarate dehydrogenase, mitochondrial n=1 Tax=Selaginella moellendorffii TaxID=88036 RepID=UPI000D1C5368|nr:D-2-hydroxyglutarate dehydrogenase, mitochondrial [Selaginella moellendorffii]|eukprot:XP_024525636.1 D-2-hydroxyglutarate dehydrogenase, mitochondrial [Selaginella moellendorffii]